MRSVKSNPNVNAAYNGMTKFEPTDAYSAGNVTKNERIPFIFLAGLVGSRGWRRESSGGGLAAGTVGSPGSSLLWSEFGMLCVEARSGRIGECYEDFCCFVFFLRDWLSGGVWDPEEERGGRNAFRGAARSRLIFSLSHKGGVADNWEMLCVVGAGEVSLLESLVQEPAQNLRPIHHHPSHL